MDEQVYKGIIIRQSDYGDAHRMLSVFTESDGIIKAVRYGIRGKKTSNAAAFQTLCYGNFRLRPSRGGIMTVCGAEIIDGFYPISEDIKKLALIAYLGDITYWLLGEFNPDKRILALFLNIIYAAAYRNEPLMKLKTVYELKLMCAGGYMPSFAPCPVCGAEAEYFRPDSGFFVCREHHRSGDIKISGGVYALMRHISSSSDKKMLAFSVKNNSIFDEMNNISEQYVGAQCEREFKSLAYFKTIINM